MRRDDRNDINLFNYSSPEARVPKNHLQRPIRQIVEIVLKDLSPQFTKVYAAVGRPSVPPRVLLRA